MTDHDILLTGKGALPFRFEPPVHRETYLGPLPKVVHQLWLDDPHPFPEKYRRFREELAAHNPDWTFKLWTDSRGIPMRNRDLYDAERNPGAKADIARYEVVHAFGGTYLDIDVRSHGHDSLDERMTRPWVRVSPDPWFNCTNAYFSFAAGSEFLAYCIRHLRDPRVRSQRETVARMGPTFFTTALLSFGDLRLVLEDGREVMSKLEHLADGNWVRWAAQHPEVA